VALLYQATLTPSKTELLQAWIPGQPWIGDADVTTVEAVGAYRFDDPDGEVGIETHLLQTADGQTLQVPLTYRGSPLDGAEASLITTMQHSVLGERWVYDACGDPVYVLALATTILSGGTQADLEVATDTGPKPWVATTRVSGSGTPGSVSPPIASVSFTDEGTTTVIAAGRIELAVLRVIDADRENRRGDVTESLTGTWPGRDAPALLAVARMT
jgi:Maltokinase N-terminal cap domain